MDASTGNFQRNVGDYKNAFVSAFQAMGGATNGLISKVGNLSNMFQSFGKAGVVGIALAGAGALINGISNGIQSSAKNTIAWRKELAKIQPLLNTLDTISEKLGSAWITIVQNMWKALGRSFRWESNPEEVEKAVELIDREVELEKDLQRIQLDEVTAQKQINDLKAIASDSDRYSDSEREKALKRIDALERKIEEQKIKYAYDAYKLQYDQRKGDEASLEELAKERELWLKFRQAEADAQAARIEREKELFQLQKNAGEEALDYRIRILESERNLLNTQISMVEANTIEEYNLRRAVADKEYEIAVATADKEKKNMTLKNKQLLEAEAKHYADLQEIEEDFTAGYLQRIKDQTDKAVADTVDGWKKAIPQLEGLLNEYNTKIAAGKPTTQTSDEWEKELAQMREAIRKTWLNGMDDIFGQVDNQVFENLKKDFSAWQQGTADYLAGEIAAYERAYEMIADKRDEILGATQLSGETDEQFLQRKQQKELEFDKHLYEMKRKIAEGYQNWYFKKVTETDTKIILSTRKTYEDYVKGIPHSVWDYMFKPTDNTMANMEQDLKNAEKRFEDAQENIQKIMRAKWKEAGKKEEDYNFNDAFNLLPESVQKDYLSKLEDFKDKEAVLLKQRLDN